MEQSKVGEDIFPVAVSCGENYVLLALFILTIKMYKICSPFLLHSVYIIWGRED